MATSLHTVDYWFPVLVSAADAVDTALTQITLQLPETAKVFRSVTLDVAGVDAQTTLGNLNRRQLSLRVGAASFTVVNNTNVMTASGEQFTWFASGDFTAHFASNWAGSSMTCDARVLADSATASALAQRDLTARLRITYEYEDTSATHVKTVVWMLAAPTAAVATAKPGTATGVVPALDTFLAEQGKSYANVAIIIQGNSATVGTVDHSLSMEIDTLGVNTTSLVEAAANTDVWYRYAWDVTGDFDTSTAHNFYLWGSAAKFNHAQVLISVTYTFDLAATVLNGRMTVGLMLPMEYASPGGGNTALLYQRGRRELWIEEPGPITTARIGLGMYWDEAAAVSGLNARIGTGSFIAFTDTAATVAGGMALGLINDAAFALARGRNELQADVYSTDTVDRMFNLSSVWYVVYTCGIPTQGIGAANRTVIWSLAQTSTIAAAALLDIAAVAPVIPEPVHFFTSVGGNLRYWSNSTSTPAGVTLLVELLSAEGGLEWVPAYVDIGYTDPEAGERQCWFTARSIFRRWSGDPSSDRIDLETARRWRIAGAQNATAFYHLDLYLTYHAITVERGGDVSGSGGGTVEIDLHRYGSGERVLRTSRVGDGAFAFDWFDDTEPVFATFYEDATHVGRSANE